MREGSAWRLDREIAVGATLVDVEAKNGKPFKILGFDWDQGGSALNWDGGALAKMPGGCTLPLRFGAARDAPSGPRDKVVGTMKLPLTIPTRGR